MKSKTLEEIRAVAEKFGVSAQVYDDGCEGQVQYYLLFEAESVEGVYFIPDQNKIRLRKPEFSIVDGDCASAIAIAVIRHYGFNYQSGNLVKTIRHSFD